ncbi:MAG: BlaI/MecI/CopY family transcriptional regulator [Acidobacteriaceae bacterium]|nr:BlaI/MecI/CopY family transcriptional regulator [Acidobacteriaceae bacterium]
MSFLKRWRGAAELGPLENEMMQVVWNRGESNVHEVMHELSKPLAYTTVMTTLDRLYKKGLLDRRKSERAFFYSAALTRSAWEQRRAGEFLSTLSPDRLVSCLVDAVEERDEALLRELEKKVRLRRKELERKKKL